MLRPHEDEGYELSFAHIMKCNSESQLNTFRDQTESTPDLQPTDSDDEYGEVVIPMHQPFPNIYGKKHNRLKERW